MHNLIYENSGEHNNIIMRSQVKLGPQGRKYYIKDIKDTISGTDTISGIDTISGKIIGKFGREVSEMTESPVISDTSYQLNYGPRFI